MNLAGTTVLVTGATDGIGRATAFRLAPLVGRLLVHGPQDRAEVELPDGAEYLQADYGELAQVRALAAAAPRIDVLVNNAGRPGAPRRIVTADGNEATLQTNYLAAVLLTRELRPARVVNVASATHYGATLELDDLNLSHHEYSAVGAYARSKLAVVTWTCALAGAGAEAVSVHPGVISTGLLHAMFSVGGDTVEHAAGNVVHAVQSEAGNGQYFDECVIADPNPFALDLSAQARLARATEELIA
jgi:NAD(P)-dependent dehydrogenase (short-subunit alcohol dehydrogenase family)